ncbi:hypothetical protein A1D22_04820 [Pasteurellaceae bacterium LFhippo2]|nr:hypothetical protein [Pasteurellaceae bacterium LFhippo2]
MKRLKQIFIAWGVFLLAFMAGFGVSVFNQPTLLAVDKTAPAPMIKSDLPYDTGEKHTFDLYLPNTKKTAYGLVVYLHAGGFTTGDKTDDVEILKFFASKGYVSAGINYSLRSENNNASVLQMSNEIKSAIPKVVEHAKQLGYPIDRMAIAGGSAGHSLAMIYAYRDHKTAPVPVKLVYGAVGGGDFDLTKWYNPNATPEEKAVWVDVMTGVKMPPEQIKNDEFGAILKPINAADWIDQDSPPSLLAHGKLDKIVPFTAVTPIHQALEKYNVPHTALVFEHSGHGLHRDREMQKRFAQLINDYFEMYLQ